MFEKRMIYRFSKKHDSEDIVEFLTIAEFIAPYGVYLEVDPDAREIVKGKIQDILSHPENWELELKGSTGSKIDE